MGIATTTATAAIRDLSDQNSQGTRLGVTATDKIGFYGLTTCVAKITVLTATMSTLSSSTGAFGFGNSQTANQIVSTCLWLQTLGLMG